MESLSDTATESDHLAVALVTGVYKITVSILLAPVLYLGLGTWGLVRWSLSLCLGAFKLLTSPLTAALHVVAFVFSPVRYLVQFMLAPLFAISAIAIKLEPLYIFFSIAAIFGTLTGLTIYLLTLPISAILTSNSPSTTLTPSNKSPPPKPSPKSTPNEDLPPTPTYTTDGEEPSFFKPNNNQPHPPLDFDTDDAKALQTSALDLRHPRPSGPDRYAEWREKVESTREGSVVSMTTVTTVQSPSGRKGNETGSKKRLPPGTLIAEIIHEEEDDSF